MTLLAIAHWRAWAPGIVEPADWAAWAKAPYVPDETSGQPDCPWLPAMQRRRLTPMARMCMHVAWPLCADDEQLPFVYASRHGETTRTLPLLREVAAGTPLSPTQFALSVHNAIAGQWSILRGQRGESTTLAGGVDTFEHAMLEARLLLASGAPAVIVVIAEEFPPDAYAGWIDDVPFSHALGLRVEAAAANEGWQLSLAQADDAGQTPSWPHALAFLRALHDPACDYLQHQGGRRRWSWQRTG
jgi:hypothetical protein